MIYFREFAVLDSVHKEAVAFWRDVFARNAPRGRTHRPWEEVSEYTNRRDAGLAIFVAKSSDGRRWAFIDQVDTVADGDAEDFVAFVKRPSIVAPGVPKEAIYVTIQLTDETRPRAEALVRQWLKPRTSFIAMDRACRWQMEPLLAACKRYPELTPEVIELDGIRRDHRCVYCGQAEHPEDDVQLVLRFPRRRLGLRLRTPLEADQRRRYRGYVFR